MFTNPLIPRSGACMTALVSVMQATATCFLSDPFYHAGSICTMKRNTHVIVPAARFRLLEGEQNLSCYQVRGLSTAKLPAMYLAPSCQCQCMLAVLSICTCLASLLPAQACPPTTLCWQPHLALVCRLRCSAAVQHEYCEAPLLQDLWHLSVL